MTANYTDAQKVPLESHAKWLRQAALSIRRDGHHGWGNTCEQAAESIEHFLTERQAGSSGDVSDEVLAIAVRARNVFETGRQKQGLPPHEDGALRCAINAVRSSLRPNMNSQGFIDTSIWIRVIAEMTMPGMAVAAHQKAVGYAKFGAISADEFDHCPTCDGSGYVASIQPPQPPTKESVRGVSDAFFARDLRNLIYVDIQFDMRGETDIGVIVIQQLTDRGWLAEGAENSEFEITDEGRAALQQFANRGDGDD